MNNHLNKIHGHIKTHHKKYLLAGLVGGVGFFVLKALLVLFGIAGIFQRGNNTYALDQNICAGVSLLSGGVDESECEALVGIYNSTQGITWNYTTNRGNTGAVCIWYGVSCTGGHVTSLNLKDNNLKGSIDLSGLPYLTTLLDLSTNLQLGTISGLGDLTGLQKLYLSDVGLSSYPSGLSNLVALKEVSFQTNNLSSFSSELNLLTNLESINLANNNLDNSNTTSINLSNLSKLETLNISSNDFSYLPNISNSNIKNLTIANNTYMSNINSIINLTSLQNIDAKNCSIDYLPDIDNLTNLKSINLYNNDIDNAGLNTFTGLSLPEGGDIRENCLTIYQTGGDSLYDYFSDHDNVKYISQDNFCGHIYDTAPSCSISYSHEGRTNQMVTATVYCTNPSYSIFPVTNYSPSQYLYFDDIDTPSQSVTMYNSIRGRNYTITDIDYNLIDITNPNCDTVPPQTPINSIISGAFYCRDVEDGIGGVSGIGGDTYTSDVAISYYFSVSSNDSQYKTVQDRAGNIIYVPIPVTGYIPNDPSCDVEIFPSTRTSGSVYVSLTNCIGKAPLQGVEWEMSLSENGPYFTTISDGDGDETDIGGTVSNIDKVAPTCNPTIVYNPAYIPGVYITGNVTATLVGCNDTGGPGSPTTPSGINGSASHTSYTFTDEGSHTLYVVDNAGNRTEYEAEVDWIDLGAPTCDLEYSTTEATSGYVIATLTGCSESVSITNTIDGESDYNFVYNGLFTFHFVDQAGNTGATLATVSNIDKVAPTCETISYSPDSLTSGDVVASLTNCSDTGSSGTNFSFIGVNGTQSNTRHTFSDNGFFTLSVVDKAGNRSNYTAQVARIDKVKPVCGITHSVTGDFVNKNNQNVLSSLTGCSEPITVTNPIGGIGEYLFTENGEFTFEFVDAAGNTGIYRDVVYWIDTDAPRCTVNYSPSGATNGNVEASLGQCSKSNITVINNSGSTGYTFTDNGNFTFEYIDDSGNTGFTVSTVTWIDREKPTCTINYTPNTSTSQNVLASIGLCSKQPIIVTNNSFLNNYLFTDNGNFTFEFRDALGNTGSTLATVTWISRGGGPTGRERDVCLDGDNSPSYYDGTCKAKETKVHGAPSVNPDICKVDKPYKFSVEQVISFQRAYSVGITTMCPIDKAGLNSNLIRKHMAKMISEFAMDVLGMEPDESKKCDFSDISKESTELRSYIKLACQLGLMGYKNDGITKKVAFEPNKVVSKAQFVAILSRLLWGTKYAGGENYFTKHANALKSHGILDRNISIFMVPQVRGPMLIMLMRAKVYLDALEKKSVLHTSAASTGSVTSGTKSSK